MELVQSVMSELGTEEQCRQTGKLTVQEKAFKEGAK